MGRFSKHGLDISTNKSKIPYKAAHYTIFKKNCIIFRQAKQTGFSGNLSC